MSKDFDVAPYPCFERETYHKEDRGFIPGKGHPDIKKTWPNIPMNPGIRPNPLVKENKKENKLWQK